MSLTLITLFLALGADDGVDPAKAAIIARDQANAQAKVNAKYGDKKSSELSQDERRQMVKDQLAADQEVLDKHGIDPKEWARDQMKRDREAYAEGKQAQKDLAAKDKAKAAAEAALKKAQAEEKEKEISVQKGFSDQNPVTLEEKPNADGTVPVEKGLPAEDSQEFKDSMSGDLMEKAAEEAPPAKRGKGSRRR